MSTDTGSDLLSDIDLTWVKRKELLFHATLVSAALFGVVMLGLLIFDVLLETAVGIVVIGIDIGTFVTSGASRNWENAGFLPAIIGSIWLIFFTLLFSFFLGVATATYLEEYAPNNRATRLIEANLTNLAGVPSVVYGLLALGVFVNGLRMGEILIAGALALALLVVPIVIVASQEALRAVPDGVRHGSLATGATRWQTIRGVVLPSAFPGIVTGTILALARAIGETAPLIMVGAVLEARQAPGPTDLFGSMPTMIYYWAFRPITEFHHLAALGILILLSILVGMYGLAFFVRNRYETGV
ncbi:MAG: phosphate ABC transporter permease PstA [Halalkalicoccus sp.]